MGCALELDRHLQLKRDAEVGGLCERDEFEEVAVMGGQSLDGASKWERRLLYGVGRGHRGDEGDGQSAAPVRIITVEEVAGDIDRLLHEYND